MDNRSALLEEIRMNPEDDLPRLVYVDWLNEHGENDRADFIRMQIALVRGRAEAAVDAALHTTAQALLQRHPEWAEGIPQGMRASFRRGFAETIVSPMEVLVRQGEYLWNREKQPLVRGLRITHIHPAEHEMYDVAAQSPQLLEHLARLPLQRHGIRELGLDLRQLDSHEVDAIRRCTNLATIRLLALSGQCRRDWFTTAELLSLRRDALPGLRMFDLRRTPAERPDTIMGEDANPPMNDGDFMQVVRECAESKQTSQPLDLLNLRNNGWTDAVVYNFLLYSDMPRIRTLDLRGNCISEELLAILRETQTAQTVLWDGGISPPTPPSLTQSSDSSPRHIPVEAAEQSAR